MEGIDLCQNCGFMANLGPNTPVMCHPEEYERMYGKPEKRPIYISWVDIVATALNIEGGFPYLDALLTGVKGWANLVVVLDRLGHATFDEVFAEYERCGYPHLENAVDELDEPRFLALSLAIIGYYLNKHDRVTVHVHQFPKVCGPLVDWFRTRVDAMITHFKWENKSVEYRMDDPVTQFYERQSYAGQNFVISLSQCLGLSAKEKTTFLEGALLAPTRFLPFDPKTSTIVESKAYPVQNSLCSDLKEILASPYLTYAVTELKNYQSANPKKKHSVDATTEFPVHCNVTLLQGDGIWNPRKTCDETLLIV